MYLITAIACVDDVNKKKEGRIRVAEKKTKVPVNICIAGAGQPSTEDRLNPETRPKRKDLGFVTLELILSALPS